MSEQRVSGAVELRHPDDVGAAFGKVEDRVVRRRLSGLTARASTPSSRAASRRSSTALIGLLIRL